MIEKWKVGISVNLLGAVRRFIIPYMPKAQCGDGQRKDKGVPKARNNENK